MAREDYEKLAEDFGTKAAKELWPKVSSGSLSRPQVCPVFGIPRLQDVAEKAFQKEWADIMFRWGEAVDADISYQLSGRD